jgi:hypothetical protein
MPDYQERLRSLTSVSAKPVENGTSNGHGAHGVNSGASVGGLLGQFVQADIVGLRCLLQQERIGQRGVRVIAIADSPLSPLAEHAIVCMNVQQASVQMMFRSVGKANWLGHLGSATGEYATHQVVEFSLDNKIVWSWGTATLARQITDVLVIR